MCGSAVLDKVSFNWAQSHTCAVLSHRNQFGCVDDWILHQDGVSALVCLSELITRFSHRAEYQSCWSGLRVETFWPNFSICILHVIHRYDIKLLLRLEGEGSNLAAQLDHLYAKYGLHTRYNKIEKSLKISSVKHTPTAFALLIYILFHLFQLELLLHLPWSCCYCCNLCKVYSHQIA